MKRGTAIGLLLACAALFVAGIGMMFKLRFDTGDIYPAYSSLRADPLGAMAFYEGLDRMPGFKVHRDFSASGRLPHGKGTTYLHLAGNHRQWRQLPTNLIKEIERFTDEGGRLVITLFPRATDSVGRRIQDTVAEVDTENDQRLISVEERWGLSFANVPLEPGLGDAYAPVTASNRTVPGLPAELSWHSGTILTNVDPAWRVVYARDEHPVLVERELGRGSVVVATDSWFVSNEALRNDRHAELLAWLVGSSRHVLFDEAHFGIVETPGVAALLRRFRLHGVVLALITLAGLFVWKNAFSLAPPEPESRTTGFVPGKDSAAGFVSLLRRHIAPDRVLGACLAEWRKTAAIADRRMARRRAEIETAVREEEARPGRERDAVGAYRRICEAGRNHTRMQ
jgi:hypothetical protein